MNISFLKGRLCAFLLAALCLNSCTQNNSSQTQCYVVIDKTGSFTNPIDGKRTAQFLMKEADVDLTQLFEMGITAFICPLSNLRNNSQEVVELPAGEGLLEVQKKRLEAQKQFQKDCAQAITRVDQGTYDHNGSQILVPLMRKLQALCDSKADKKIFVIMSDLIEHSSSGKHNASLSFYNAKDDVIRTSIDEALNEYAPSLSGVTIINIYKPSDAREDALFDRVRGIWKDALTDRGATFTYVPNL